MSWREIAATRTSLIDLSGTHNDRQEPTCSIDRCDSKKISRTKVECSDIPWLRVPEINRSNGPLAKIFQALRCHRGHMNFATEGRKLVCDVVIPSRRLIVEYDERQHFSVPRAIALRLYPKDMLLCFNREEWIAHCDTIAAKDNDPRYRDEQRAFYDSVRDILAAANGYQVARLKHGAIDWETCNADAEIMRRLSVRHTTPNKLVPRLVTVCVKGEWDTNKRRLELLKHVVDEIKNKNWEKLDAIIFPGGFLRLKKSIGHLSYNCRVEALNKAGFVEPIKKAVKVLNHSPGALIVVGVDGSPYRNGDGGDQLCVSIKEDGIAGIGRKVFPTKGDEANALLCYDADFGESRRVVTLPSGGKAILAACYDMFGVAERGDINGTRAKLIRRIGTGEDQVKRSDRRRFHEQLRNNLAALNGLLTNENVSVGITAIHGIWENEDTGRQKTATMWQRHGIATCSAALGKGFAVGAAHFDNLPSGPDVSTLAAKNVPEEHLHLEDLRKRTAHSWEPSDSFLCDKPSVLVRLFDA